LSLSSLGYRCCPIDIELSGLRENINAFSPENVVSPIKRDDH